MIAILVCTDPDCRASFEGTGSEGALRALHCDDCGAKLDAVSWRPDEADRPQPASSPDGRRAA